MTDDFGAGPSEPPRLPAGPHGQVPPPPPFAPPPPGSQPPPPGSRPPPGSHPPPPGWGGMPAQPGPPPYSPPPPPGKKSAWPWVLGGLALLLVVVVVGAAIVIAVAASDDSESSRDADPEVADDAAESDGSRDVTGAADEVDDVRPCQWVDDETVLLDITNNSSEQSSYVIDINFLDAAGNRVGDEPFFVNYVRPGERAVEESFIFDAAGGVDCEIAEVERFSAESPDDVSEVTCATNGVDFADDIASTFNASNGSSETSDYFVTAAFMRDGVRIGTAFASIENVRPGESAPGDGFSVVDGPDDGVSCEVVHVSRTSSE